MVSAASRGRVRHLTIVLVALASVGALLLGACGGGDKKANDTKPVSPTATGGGVSGDAVTVKLSEYKFETPTTSFTAGKAYQIKAENVGIMEHDFHAFPKGVREEARAIAKIPASELGAGKSATTSMTLPSAGDYEFVCTVPGHEQLGMKLDVKATS